MMWYGQGEITNNDDYVDMRNVTCRIATLEGYVEDTSLIDRYGAGEAFADLPWAESDAIDEDELDELLALRTLSECVPGLDSQLIRESAFQAYAEQFAEDVYGSDNPLYAYTDWEKFANDMQMDYTIVEWDGVTYYYQ